MKRLEKLARRVIVLARIPSYLSIVTRLPCDYHRPRHLATSLMSNGPDCHQRSPVVCLCVT